jgi:hypothetical protein
MGDKPAAMTKQLRELRERTIERLSAHYAYDELDLEDFERRVELVEKAGSEAELLEIVRDLGEPKSALVPVARAGALAARDVPDKRSIMSIFGGTTRRGSWTVPRQLRVVAVMGGAEVDFREADFGSGVHEVRVFALFGGITVIVPPDVRVEVDGTGVLGGFDDQTTSNVPAGATDPSLRIRGVALLGGIEVCERLPGESAREARRRIKRESKARRKEARLRPASRERDQLNSD